MSKSFSFSKQLSMGREGELKAIEVLSARYGKVTDLTKDAECQHNGIDLYVEDLGYCEIKSDSHEDINLFLEVDCDGRPGALFSSCAEWYVFLYSACNCLYLIKRAALAHWVFWNWYDIEEYHKNWIKTITSKQGNNTWEAIGVIVPIDLISQDIKVERWKLGE